MEFIIENFEYVVLMLVVVLIVLIISLIIMNARIGMFFSNKRFRIKALSNIDPDTREKQFTIQIFNNNVNDTRITALGFLYQNQSIDYYRNHLKSLNLPIDYKVFIPSREFIVVRVDIDQIKNLISDINKNNEKVSKLSTYIIDSLGMQTIINAKQIRKQIDLNLKEERRQLKIEKQLQRKKLIQEKKLIKQTKKLENKLKRKEKWNKSKLKFKNMFKKRK